MINYSQDYWYLYSKHYYKVSVYMYITLNLFFFLFITLSNIHITIILTFSYYETIVQGVVAKNWNKLCFRQLPVTSICLNYVNHCSAKSYFLLFYCYTVILCVLHCMDLCTKTSHETINNNNNWKNKINT